jgi:hypothetical protein
MEVSMPRSLFAAFLALSAILVLATPGMALAGGGDEAVKATGVPGTAVATVQKPATVQVQDAANGGATLEVTARPVKGAGASPGYLVGVFDEGQPGGAAPKLLGSFSFYPPRAGVAQTFVIPRSQFDETMSKSKVTLSIKLIPANPAADIKDAAVEILGARLVR